MDSHLAHTLAARVDVVASGQVTLTASALWEIPEPECTAVTLVTRKTVLTQTLTRGQTCKTHTTAQNKIRSNKRC